MTRTNGDAYKTSEVGLDTTHLIENHHPALQTGPYLEPPVKEEEGTSKKLLEVGCRSRATVTRYVPEQCSQSSPDPCSFDD